jgi:hypothetical protein
MPGLGMLELGMLELGMLELGLLELGMLKLGTSESIPFPPLRSGGGSGWGQGISD